MIITLFKALILDVFIVQTGVLAYRRPKVIFNKLRFRTVGVFDSVSITKWCQLLVSKNEYIPSIEFETE